MQGDAYNIPIEILTSDGTPANEGNLEDVEVTLGCIIKSLAKKEILFNSKDKVFEFPLTQDETFQLYENKYDIQVRVKTTENQVVGFKLREIAVIKSRSKVVLETKHNIWW